jgi:hypothetical protein
MPKLSDYILTPEGRHKIEVPLVAWGLTLALGWVAVHGFGYYRLSPARRAFHPLNAQLRPSGTIGLRLAFFGVFAFFWMFLYAVRKRWKWLSKIGKTRNWLDVHVVLGVAAPAAITLHSGFRMRGIAGVAYWIMIAVMASGFVGRYLYAQIPRRINAAEISLQEMQTVTGELTEQLHKQSVVSAEELKPLLVAPTQEDVDKMSVPAALLMMVRYDLRRPFLVAAVRRRSMGAGGRFLTFWGLLRSRHRALEQVIDLARRRSWMATKISFLSKAHEVFHWWHVVHRPFSYSFAVLVCLHITVAMLMGYY